MDEQDFESTTSTNSITPANTVHIIQETPPICKSKISQQTSKKAVKGGPGRLNISSFDPASHRPPCRPFGLPEENTPEKSERELSKQQFTLTVHWLDPSTVSAG